MLIVILIEELVLSLCQQAKRGVGAEVWETLPEQAKAALTSIAYNYGSLR